MSSLFMEKTFFIKIYSDHYTWHQQINVSLGWESIDVWAVARGCIFNKVINTPWDQWDETSKAYTQGPWLFSRWCLGWRRWMAWRFGGRSCQNQGRQNPIGCRGVNAKSKTLPLHIWYWIHCHQCWQLVQLYVAKALSVSNGVYPDDNPKPKPRKTDQRYFAKDIPHKLSQYRKGKYIC